MNTTCGVCGGVVRYTGLPWHVNCRPPCRVCGQPVHNWTVRGVDVHQSCERTLASARHWHAAEVARGAARPADERAVLRAWNDHYERMAQS